MHKLIMAIKSLGLIMRNIMKTSVELFSFHYIYKCVLVYLSDYRHQFPLGVRIYN